jgi:hypothetical protein
MSMLQPTFLFSLTIPAYLLPAIIVQQISREASLLYFEKRVLKFFKNQSCSYLHYCIISLTVAAAVFNVINPCPLPNDQLGDENNKRVHAQCQILRTHIAISCHQLPQHRGNIYLPVQQLCQHYNKT